MTRPSSINDGKCGLGEMPLKILRAPQRCTSKSARARASKCGGVSGHPACSPPAVLHPEVHREHDREHRQHDVEVCALISFQRRAEIFALAIADGVKLRLADGEEALLERCASAGLRVQPPPQHPLQRKQRRHQDQQQKEFIGIVRRRHGARLYRRSSVYDSADPLPQNLSPLPYPRIRSPHPAHPGAGASWAFGGQELRLPQTGTIS